MKKILMTFLVITSFIYCNSLSKINSIQAKVTEQTFINKNTKEKVYTFQMKYPDKVYKEMLSPKINIGEKYIYNGKKKQVFYPLLGDSFIEEIDEDENYILQAIKAIKDGRKTFTLENNEIKTLDMGDGITITFSAYKVFDNLNFPLKVEVFDGKRLVSKLVFSEIKINKVIDDKIFNIK